MTSDFPTDIASSAVVHWCPADDTHRLHVIIGARGGPGWYVFTLNGCLGRVVGPFRSERAARDAATSQIVQAPTRIANRERQTNRS